MKTVFEKKTSYYKRLTTYYLFNKNIAVSVTSSRKQPFIQFTTPLLPVPLNLIRDSNIIYKINYTDQKAVCYSTHLMLENNENSTDVNTKTMLSMNVMEDHCACDYVDDSVDNSDGAMRYYSKRRLSGDKASMILSPSFSDCDNNNMMNNSSNKYNNYIEDEQEEKEESVQLVSHPLRVVRPVPKRISEQFYDEAYRVGSTLQETNEAAIMAHDWHRKWTQQDEANHTMPDQDFYKSSNNVAAVPISYRYDFLDREEGAKNPFVLGSSPDEDEEERKQPLGLSSSSKQKNRRVKRSRKQDVEEDEQQQQLPTIPPVMVRPVAIRANRPGYVVPVLPLTHPEPTTHTTHDHGRIPQDIFTTNQIVGDRVTCVSPMSYSDSGPLGSTIRGVTVLDSQEHQQQWISSSEEVGVHLVMEDDDDVDVEELTTANNSMDDRNSTVQTLTIKIKKARDDVLRVLAINDGDVESDEFKTKIDPLEKFFLGRDIDTRSGVDHRLCPSPAKSVEGMWLTLSKPSWFGCLGLNDNGDPMYTLGRMSFDMFSPTNLVCSLQGNFNRVEILSGEERKAMLKFVPTKLREEVENGETVLRTYHIMTAFTIEPSMAAFPDAPNKDVTRPIKGIMTTYGYSLPDPGVPNRHSIWFTGGRIEPNDASSDILAWKKFFTIHPPKHSFGEKAKLLAVKLLMGATIPKEIDPVDGSMSYDFTRPLGGHGMAYVDVIYLDDSMRIVRGQRGTIFVFSRVSDI